MPPVYLLKLAKCNAMHFLIPVCVCILLCSKHVGKNAQVLLHIWIEVDLVKNLENRFSGFLLNQTSVSIESQLMM